MSIFDGLPDIFTETFGEPAIYSPRDGEPIEINVIIIEEPGIAALNNADVVSRTVTGHARTVDVPAIAEGDWLALGAREFSITEPINSDGKGMTFFNLARGARPSLDFSQQGATTVAAVI